MKDREPTVRSRELGEELRRAMESAGYNGTQIAEELGWSQGRVSRLLGGKRGGSGSDVSAFLALCGIKSSERERLMALAGDQYHPGWFLQHGRAVPKQVRTLFDHEGKALTISEFQAMQVPGLLQTPEYARAVLSRSASIPHEEIDDRVQARRAHHELINHPRAPFFTFFMHEYALRVPVGGPVVISDQLHALLRMSVRPNVTLRVVPANVGAYAGMAGSFTLMEVRDFKPIVYLESETSSLFLETPVEIETYSNILTSLNEVALNKEHSRDLIGTLATTFGAEEIPRTRSLKSDGYRN